MSDNKMREIDLALDGRSAEKAVFEEIYRLHLRLMYRTAFSVLQNRELAEDAVQESLLIIARNIPRFSEMDSDGTAAFITIIVRNKAISMLKKEHTERGGRDAVSYDEEIDLRLSDEISMQENYSAVLSAIKSLDAIYSDVLMFKHVYGYDSRTIAELFGVSVRTVDSRLYRGKKLLADKLEEFYGLQKLK